MLGSPDKPAAKNAGGYYTSDFITKLLYVSYVPHVPYMPLLCGIELLIMLCSV
jgi:hypothetical protein